MMKDSGYVLIAYQQVSIETSLWVLVIAVVLLFTVIHWLFNLASNWRSPAEKLRRWSEARGDKKAGSKSNQALEAELEGDLWKARRLFIQAAELSRTPALFYLEAARCAAEQGDDKEAHRILIKAAKESPQSELRLQLEQVRFDIKSGHYERASELLSKLTKERSNSTAVDREKAALLSAKRDWNALLPMLPGLQKRRVLNSNDIQVLRRTAALSRLNNLEETSRSALDRCWEELSYEAQQDPEVRRAYIGQLTALHETADACAQIIKWLAKNWDNDLAVRLSELPCDDPDSVIKTAKGWLKQQPDNGAIELVLARLSRRAQLWGAAITHYRKSLELNHQAQPLIELTELYIQLGEQHEAAKLLSSKNAPLQLPTPSEADRTTRQEIIR
jgi:HemY protein